MKKTRFAETQIVAAIKKQESGVCLVPVSSAGLQTGIRRAPASWLAIVYQRKSAFPAFKIVICIETTLLRLYADEDNSQLLHFNASCKLAA